MSPTRPILSTHPRPGIAGGVGYLSARIQELSHSDLGCTWVRESGRDRGHRLIDAESGTAGLITKHGRGWKTSAGAKANTLEECKQEALAELRGFIFTELEEYNARCLAKLEGTATGPYLMSDPAYRAMEHLAMMQLTSQLQAVLDHHERLTGDLAAFPYTITSSALHSIGRSVSFAVPFAFGHPTRSKRAVAPCGLTILAELVDAEGQPPTGRLNAGVTREAYLASLARDDFEGGIARFVKESLTHLTRIELSH